MEAVENIAVSSPAPQRGKLLRVLGVGFGLAIAVGAAVGIGILRNPGGVAGQLGSYWLIVFAWVLGGVFCLLGANYLAELATMTPKAGGFYVHAHRAFGDYGGFVVGWSDWANNTLALAYVAVAFGEYASVLFFAGSAWGRVICSVSVIVILTAVNWISVRSGSGTQQITSLVKAIALLAFVGACFAFGGTTTGTTPPTAAVEPKTFLAGLAAFILAFQIVLGTYDGYYGPIYFAEEDTNPSRNLVRSMFGGIAIITAIYVLVNLALLHVLPMEQLAASKFAGGDAMAVMFGTRAGQIVTVLALISLIGILNAVLMQTPRILFALSRDGLFTPRAMDVNGGGTPYFGLLITALTAVLLAVVGSFELLLAIGGFLIVFVMIVLVAALFVLRRREPDAPRPYRTWGYPFTPIVMLIFAVLLFVGYAVSNPFPSAIAAGALVLSYPLFLLIKRS
jgi:APA family basic amino acid/polyamine antiporter